MTVGFIHKLDQCSFKLSLPSRTTGMTTLKKMIKRLAVFATGRAVDCVLDQIIPMN
jgi:hypothetical protein